MNKGHSDWLCKCDCGNSKIARGSHLKEGDIKSCGCLVRDTNHNRLWKGFYIKDGYKWLSFIGRKGISESRYIMQRLLGRDLLNNEIVHHTNCDKLDNCPKNLKVMTISEHVSLHRRKASK